MENLQLVREKRRKTHNLKMKFEWVPDRVMQGKHWPAADELVPPRCLWCGVQLLCLSNM